MYFWFGGHIDFRLRISVTIIRETPFKLSVVENFAFSAGITTLLVKV